MLARGSAIAVFQAAAAAWSGPNLDLFGLVIGLVDQGVG